MPKVATLELASAVASAGGLGMLAGTRVPIPVLAETLEQAVRQCGTSIGVNFLMPHLEGDEAVRVAAERVKFIEFFYGDPDPALVDLIHASGALACWQVGSVDEALAAERSGCDLIVAQGTEAGGHVRGSIGLFPLLTEILETVKVPVIAAGGIGTARSMAAALTAGAAAVRVGTRFVATKESGAHPKYIEKLIGARAEDTILTEAYSVMWPDAPHRVLKSCIEIANSLDDDVVGEDLIGAVTVPMPRFAAPLPGRDTTGNIEAMALYAGQSVDAVRGIQSAAEIVSELSEGAERLLRGSDTS
jgi:NAD(P)H-dependent flavin oxidoreductase YrpB (nitropropane dioxygenase family)